MRTHLKVLSSFDNTTTTNTSGRKCVGGGVTINFRISQLLGSVRDREKHREKR